MRVLATKDNSYLRWIDEDHAVLLVRHLAEPLFLLNKKEALKYENKGKITVEGEKIWKTLFLPDAWIYITYNCNLRCSYCYVRKINKSLKKEDFPKLKEILTKFKKRIGGRRFLIDYSGGEPLVYPHLEELILYLKQHFPDDYHGVLTNGLLLEDFIDFFSKNNVELRVSLDGFGNANGERMNEEQTKKVWKNILKAKNKGIKVYVSITLTEKNIKSLPDFMETLAKEEIPAGITFVRYLDALKPEKNHEKIVEAYKEMFKRLGKYDIVYAHLLDRILPLYGKPASCGYGNEWIAITPDLKLKPCQFDPRSFSSFRQIPKNNYEVSKECYKCVFFDICKGTCPLIRKNGKSPFCKLYKEIIPLYLEYLGKQFLKEKTILDEIDRPS